MLETFRVSPRRRHETSEHFAKQFTTRSLQFVFVLLRQTVQATVIPLGQMTFERLAVQVQLIAKDRRSVAAEH